MDVLKAFMTGTLDAAYFIEKLRTSPELQDEIRQLMPGEAVCNKEHPLWKSFAFEVMHSNGFDIVRELQDVCRFDGTLEDNLNLFGILKHFYGYKYPDDTLTTKYHDAFSLYLDAIQDCFEGPEVDGLVNEIIEKYLPLQPKTRRKKEAKEAVRKAFHVENRKRPYWIQGAEWPMGEDSPMRFVKRVQRGEQVDYYFEDVKTGVARIVTQYY